MAILGLAHSEHRQFAALSLDASKSKSCQTFRAVIGNGNAGNLLQRAVRFGSVPHQLRSVRVELIEVVAVWRNPVVAGTAADVPAEASEGAIALYDGASRILCNSDIEAIDM